MPAIDFVAGLDRGPIGLCLDDHDLPVDCAQAQVARFWITCVISELLEDGRSRGKLRLPEERFRVIRG